nr:MAG TPA: hypothetical protein [Microviridae sp.]
MQLLNQSIYVRNCRYYRRCCYSRCCWYQCDRSR